MPITTAEDLAALGVSAHDGYADELPVIETPLEAYTASLELSARLLTIARLEVHPRSNAIALLENHAEAGLIAEQLASFLLFFEVPEA